MALIPLTVADQIYERLRLEIAEGRLRGKLPGADKLAAELGVAKNTLLKALRRLESERLVVCDKNGAGRSVVARRTRKKAPGAHVGVFFCWEEAHEDFRKKMMKSLLCSALKARGHKVTILYPAPGDDMNAPGRRLDRTIREAEPDCWIVVIGTFEVLRRFVETSLPVFAWGGRCHDFTGRLASAGYSSIDALHGMMRRLLESGHRRVVLIVRKDSRGPHPSPRVTAFAEDLATVGIRPGGYHLPEWEESPAGIRRLLDSLFQVTPPTAIITSDARVLTATLDFFSRRRLRIPEDVSLAFLSECPEVEWQVPELRLAHVFIDYAKALKPVVDWVGGVVAGRPDTGSLIYQTPWVPGNSLGPAKG